MNQPSFASLSAAMVAGLSLQTCLLTIYIYISMQKVNDRVQKNRMDAKKQGAKRQGGRKMTEWVQNDRMDVK